MWFLQARCGLLFTIIHRNHHHNHNLFGWANKPLSKCAIASGGKPSLVRSSIPMPPASSLYHTYWLQVRVLHEVGGGRTVQAWTCDKAKGNRNHLRYALDPRWRRATDNLMCSIDPNHSLYRLVYSPCCSKPERLIIMFKTYNCKT